MRPNRRRPRQPLRFPHRPKSGSLEEHGVPIMPAEALEMDGLLDKMVREIMTRLQVRLGVNTKHTHCAFLAEQDVMEQFVDAVMAMLAGYYGRVAITDAVDPGDDSDAAVQRPPEPREPRS